MANDCICRGLQLHGRTQQLHGRTQPAHSKLVIAPPSRGTAYLAVVACLHWFVFAGCARVP
eukprot:2808823-Pleurochrysis_carterae.AAC.3